MAMARRLLVVLVLCTANYAVAQCMAPHAATGQVVQVIEDGGLISWFRAISTYRTDGHPIIYYGQSYWQLPPLMRQFVSIHECAHLAEPTSDEFLANCRALQVLRQRGLTPQDEDYIAQFHYNEGPLPPQYGGSGVTFWGQTLACAGPRVP